MKGHNTLVFIVIARLLFLFSVVFVAVAGSAQSSPPAHGKDFWRAVSKAEGKTPDGSQPSDLAPELIADLGSTDSELRDTLAYDILVDWIYKGVLTPEQIRPLMQTLRENLRAGIGETGTDTVLRRSFSALILSVIAARNVDRLFLTPEERESLLNSALTYLADEKDERGYDPQKGWVHSVAHTADLIKFLVRDPRLTAGDEKRILDALLAKVRAASQVYAHGEDERLARVLISLARREPAEKTALLGWVHTTAADAAFAERLTPENMRVAANSRHLLTSLFAEMSVDERPSAGLDFLREAVRDSLKKVL